MSLPKRVVVEYEDGTRRETPFASLGGQARLELAALGLGGGPSAGGYLLLEWKDGWKEVVAADEGAQELLRYYTVERMEQVGRLAIERAGANPQLVLIERLPSFVERITFVNSSKCVEYTLAERATVKEGGKVEHIFYDKTKAGLRMEEATQPSGRFDEVLAFLEQELTKRSTSPASVGTLGEGERVALFRDLARGLGLKGTHCERDVFGLLQLGLDELNRRKK